MLLGSDYTDGIRGIGPVNGIEIVQTFCSESDSIDGLKDFKQWIYSPERDKKPKKNWFVPHGFPDEKVVNGYLKPDVDESDAKFEWGKPDIEKLIIVCREKFHWDERTTNLTLDPIAKIVEN